MPELTTAAAGELSEATAALTRHARDEALRRRAQQCADRLAGLRGHEAIAEELLRLFERTPGSGGAVLFYRLGDAICRRDDRGGASVGVLADDGLVRYVLENGVSVRRRTVLRPAGEAGPGLRRAATHWLPLSAGDETAGVLRLEDPGAAGDDLLDEIEPLLSFAGPVLADGTSTARDALLAEGASRVEDDRQESAGAPAGNGAWLARAKRALGRRLEERGDALAGILGRTSAPVYSFDAELRYLAFDPHHAEAVRTLHGAEIGAGRSVLELVTDAGEREATRRKLEKVLTGEPLQESTRSGDDPGACRYYEVSYRPLLERDGSVLGGAVLATDVTEARFAEEDRASHLRVLEALDLVNRAMQGTSDLEQMLSDVLDVAVAVFGCDRAWLVHPCDPASPTYRVPMERTRTEYPGALSRGLEVPVDAETAAVLKALKESPGPVTFGPGLDRPLPGALSERFHVRSQIAVAVHPRVSAPYAFGLHQCSSPRRWTDQEAILLQEIGRRLGDALTSLRAFHDLEVSEGRYRTLLRQIQAAVVVHGADGRVLSSNRKAQELLGLPEERMTGRPVTDPAWSFFRRDGSAVPPEEYPARLVSSNRQPLRDLVARIHRSQGGEAGDVWVLVNADPVLGRDGEVSQVIVTLSDVTGQRRAEERLQKEAERVSRLLDLFLRSPEMSEKEVFAGVLDLALRLTGSTIGMLHHLADDRKTVRTATWNEGGLESSSAVPDGPCPIEEAGSWADCVRQGRPVIREDLASSPGRKGSGKGDAPLRRSLSVPVVEAGLVRIVFGVGNKETAYDEGDVFQVQQVANELLKLMRQRQAVERIEVLGRLYRAISEMNQVIVREKSRERLFAEVCRIGVEHAGFAMAWAGLVDGPGGVVRPVGAAGLEADYAGELEVRLDAPVARLRPAARAVLEDRAVVVDDTESDPGFAPWREEARRRGFRSCAVFPVRADGRVRGVLAVYAVETGVFQGEAAALLGELAADLGFTLRALEAEELRARAEHALRESEERYRLIAENTADTIALLDLDLRFTYVSPAVLKLRGYTAEECLAQPIDQVVTPASLEEIRRRLAEELGREATGGPDPSRSSSIELEEYCRDGSTIWVEVTFSFLRDAASRPTGILAVTRDITKRRRADLRLAESERQYRMLAESSPDNIIRYDADGRMVYVNANLERSVDFDFGSRLGTIPHEEPAFSAFEPYLAKLREVIRSGQPAELEMEVRSPAGGTRTHGIRFVAERDEAGRVVGALAFGRDITDRKEAARERQRYLVQLRQNLEDAVAAIAATVEARDPYTAGHQRGVAALAAEIARELGLDAETVQGIHLAGTIHDLGKIKIPAEILARPGGLSALETRLVRLHPEAGWEILKGVEFPWPIAEMVLQHHERRDGSGYPKGLRGEEISLGARILAVADVVEAAVSHRPYRPARSLDRALSEIEQEEGAFDPAVVKACLTLFRERGFRL